MPNSDDLCPNTPPGVAVDEFGCTLVLNSDDDDTSGNEGAASNVDKDDNGSADSGRDNGPGGNSSGGDKDPLLLQQQPGTPNGFDGELQGEMNICGYITPVSLGMLFAGLMLMRVGTGRRRF